MRQPCDQQWHLQTGIFGWLIGSNSRVKTRLGIPTALMLLQCVFETQSGVLTRAPLWSISVFFRDREQILPVLVDEIIAASTVDDNPTASPGARGKTLLPSPNTPRPILSVDIWTAVAHGASSDFKDGQRFEGGRPPPISCAWVTWPLSWVFPRARASSWTGSGTSPLTGTSTGCKGQLLFNLAPPFNPDSP